MTLDLGIAGLTDAGVVGRGGFATVYRATQEQFGRAVAVKVLSADDVDQVSRDRFERECKALGVLSHHPGIVTVYEGGFTDAGHPYLVMEFYPKGSLADRIETSGPIASAEVAEIGAGLADALAAAHAAEIIHRDIKPANVLVGAYGQTALADFGIARIAGAAETKSGVITATLAHAAPEVLGGDRPSVAADIYSLGSTLYELVTGAPAFLNPEDEGIVPMLQRIATAPVPDLRSRGVSPELSAVIERSMGKDPDDRFGDASSMAAALRRAADADSGATVSVHALPPTPRTAIGNRPTGRRRRVSQIGAAAVAVALAAGAGIAVTRASSDTDGAGPPETSTTATTAPEAAAPITTVTTPPTTTGVVAERPQPGEAIFNDAIAARTPFFGDIGVYTQGGDDAPSEAAMLGAWYALADWCADQGLGPTGTCYDYAAQYLTSGFRRDPRTINDETWQHPGAIGGVIDLTYGIALEHLGVLQPGETPPTCVDCDGSRPGIDVLCEPSCSEVLDR